MTEAEWLACTSPEAMLRFARDEGSGSLDVAEGEQDPERRVFFVRGWATHRKLLLFACACYRRATAFARDGRFGACVAAFERFVGGEVTLEALTGQCHAFYTAGWDVDPAEDPILDERTAALGLAVTAKYPTEGLLDHAEYLWRIRAASEAAVNAPGWAEAVEGERAAQCVLLREIFGNPFRRAAIDPIWLAWGGGIVPALAEGISAAGDHDQLCILADALLDAGCTADALLAHLRSAGPHVRGCWALDLILGKE